MLYSLYDKKSKGSFGAKKTKRDEVTQVTNISSQITSGGDMVLASGGNQRYQAAKLNSGEDLIINSGGSVTFEAVKDLHQESHEKSSTSLAWTSMATKSATDETLRQSQITAKGQLVINGGSFGSNLGDALIGEGIDLGAALGNKAIGDLAAGLEVAPKIAEKLILHAALGGLIAKARGESFASGAIAGGIAEGLTPIANGLLAEFVSSRFDATDLSSAGSQLKIGTAQIIGLIAAGVAGGNPATGSLIGGTAEKYNDQGFHLDPTDQFDDSGAPLQPATSAIDKLKAEISQLILMTLFPELVAVRAEGWLAKLTGMFSKSTEEAALAGAGTKVGAGGAVEVATGTKAGASGAAEIASGTKATGSGARFADQAKLDDHFARHGSDFGAKNTLEYQAQADKFLTVSKPAGVLEKVRPNGDIVRYNPSTDEFGVVSSGGNIRTYYKPDPAVHGKVSNLEYFNGQ